MANRARIVPTVAGFQPIEKDQVVRMNHWNEMVQLPKKRQERVQTTLEQLVPERTKGPKNPKQRSTAVPEEVRIGVQPLPPPPTTE
jgi:hypothetical protein